MGVAVRMISRVGGATMTSLEVTVTANQRVVDRFGIRIQEVRADRILTTYDVPSSAAGSRPVRCVLT